MNKQEFLNKLQVDLEIESVKLEENTAISSIDEWDSLAAMTVLSILDENFDVNFNVSELNNLESIKDIILLVGKERFTD